MLQKLLLSTCLLGLASAASAAQRSVPCEAVCTASICSNEQAFELCKKSCGKGAYMKACASAASKQKNKNANNKAEEGDLGADTAKLFSQEQGLQASDQQSPAQANKDGSQGEPQAPVQESPLQNVAASGNQEVPQQPINMAPPAPVEPQQPMPHEPMAGNPDSSSQDILEIKKDVEEIKNMLQQRPHHFGPHGPHNPMPGMRAPHFGPQLPAQEMRGPGVPPPPPVPPVNMMQNRFMRSNPSGQFMITPELLQQRRAQLNKEVAPNVRPTFNANQNPGAQALMEGRNKLRATGRLSPQGEFQAQAFQGAQGESEKKIS